MCPRQARREIANAKSANPLVWRFARSGRMLGLKADLTQTWVGHLDGVL
jgi:hypothetical protein